MTEDHGAAAPARPAASDLRGRVAVVTGAAGGIGRATALRLAQDGADLALIDIAQNALQVVASAVRGYGVRVVAVVADCGARDSITEAFATVRADLGDPHVLVNNVGTSVGSGLFSDTRFEALDEQLDVNLKAAMYWSRLVVGPMRDRRDGKIVNVASDAALVGDVGAWAYAAAKAGVIAFSRSLARELAPSGVNVNVVAPGFTRTAMTEKVTAESRERILAMTPMGAIIEPEDIAEAIAFLASDCSRFITGQTLAVNGGRWML